MCNPQLAQSVRNAALAASSTNPNQGGGPNSIPSPMVMGVGSTTSAPNGMPMVAGGPPQVQQIADGQQPMSGVAIPGSVPGNGLGMQPQPGAQPPIMPPPGAVGRIMSGGPMPNGRGRVSSTR